MILPDTGLEPLRIFGHAIAAFPSPGAAMASAFGLGWLLGAVPIGAAEAAVLVLATVQPPALVVPLVLLNAFGHVLGKLLWYWLGTQHGRVTNAWLRRQVDTSAAVARRHPRLSGATLLSSALVSLPPFHLTVIGAGIVRAPVGLFLLTAFAGRAIRFSAVALVPQLVPWLVP
ncbi:MAG: hypothetical protein IT355_12375 [Gemmatimonadaceae bacterium]|nr:hypothetical protein [Gemmatimonadaceae bacterium]